MVKGLETTIKELTGKELKGDEILEAKTNLFGFLELLMQIDAETKDKSEAVKND